MDISSDETNNRSSPLIVSPAAARRLHLIMGDRQQDFPLGGTAFSNLPGLRQEEPFMNGDTEDGHGVFVMECNAMILGEACSADLKDSVTQGAECRNYLHDCVAYAHVMDRLGVQSGDLVEISNPERPSISPRVSRIWTAGDDCVIKGDVAISPFLGYNIGIAYHLAPFFKLREKELSKEMFKVNISKFVERKTSQEEVAMAEICNPSTGSVQVQLATSLGLKAIREPDASGDFLPEVEDDGGEHGKSTQGVQEPEEETAAQCIENYFGGRTQIVSLGDVIAIPVPSASIKDPGLVISAINAPLTTEGDPSDINAASVGVQRVLYFKVTSLKPSSPLILAVDSEQTTINLEGVTNSGYPVGALGYMFGRKESSCLGWCAHASWMNPASVSLPYIGRLLPLWEKIASIVACTMHPSSLNIRMRTSILLHGPHGAGKRVAARAASAALGIHFLSISCEDIRPEGLPDDKVVEALEAVMSIASQYKPVILFLRDINVLAQPGAPTAESQAARVGAALFRCILKGLGDGVTSSDSGPLTLDHEPSFPSRIFIIGTASDIDAVDPSIRRCFTHELEADAPESQERRLLLESYFGQIRQHIAEDTLDDIVQHTAGLMPLELKNVAAEACASATLALHQDDVAKMVAPRSTTEPKEDDGQVDDSKIKLPPFTRSCVDSAIVSVRQKTATDIGAPKIPNVQWNDVGGLEDVKLGILDTVELPLKHPELFAGGLRRRSGVLLYGPPGTGKTLLAKAVATECSVNFLSIKGPELINMYVGESERLVRDVFIRARRAKPCVIFFDELDSLAPARGRGSDSGGIMDRVVSQLLAEIDSAQSGSGSDDVFIIGATNRPDLLDPALLRPGRLDRLLYVGIASEKEDRRKVLEALTRKFVLEQDVDLDSVAEACPSRLTGADMYGLCSKAWMSAFKRTVTEDQDATRVSVKQEDFLSCVASITPSLTVEDVARYEAIRNEYNTGTR
ncbi:hypothetical protein M9435_004696 [Picochlorum sp. BPE23]|nr:hypothetical protein M9435_004696 [Picochlorum sp. BPE23]